MRNNLSFMDKYRKDELVSYLASLHLFSQNSSFGWRMSVLLYKALGSDGGNSALSTLQLQKDIERYYPSDMNEDPQEYLFVDMVHTGRGSFRVFPGLFSYLQYNLSRLFELSEIEKIDGDCFAPVYALLGLSDRLALQCGYGRYEKGEPEREQLYFPTGAELERYIERISFSRSDLSAVFIESGADASIIDQLICHANREEFEDFQFCQSGFSPIERTPFYGTGDGRLVVLQPSALLSAAYLICLEVIKSKIGVEKLNKRYLDVLMSEIGVSMKQSGAINFGGGIVDFRIGYQLFPFDNGGIACITTTHQDTTDEDLRTIEALVRQHYKDSSVFYVETINSIDVAQHSYSTCFDHIIIPIDEFKIMIGTKGMDVTNLYYYYKSRMALRNVRSQEIDLFAYYWYNKHTFYRDEQPSFFNIMAGTAYDIRFEYLKIKDEHLVDGPKSMVMIRHFDEYPDELPIYIPIGDENKTVFIEESGNISLTTVADYKNDDEKLLLREIVKCIAVWTYGFWYKFNENLLNRNLILIVNLYDKINPQIYQNGENCLVYSIPNRFIEYKRNNYDRLVVSFLIEALAKFGLSNVDMALMKAETMFSECKGKLLLIEPDGADFWFVNDGYDASYNINESACDCVLDDIARYLALGGEKRALSLKESKDVALKVIEYLGISLNGLLKRFTSDKFVDSLLKLHHGSLYWLAVTGKRFQYVNAVLSYLGSDWREQKALLFKYSETNNLTQCLLERIAANGFHSDANPNIEDIDRIFAYMHELFIFGSYLDILTFKIPGTEMVILANGRVALPQDKMNEQFAYFLDLRENELFRPESYEKLNNLKDSLNIDVDDIDFIDAFKEEFSIGFKQWKSIVKKSLDFAFDSKRPIVCISIQEFEKTILRGTISEKLWGPFKEKFALYAGVSEGSLPSESFVQRFNREFQISSRPWIYYAGMVMYSTKSLHQHERVMLERLNEGKINARSRKMVDYMGKINSRKGPVFEKKLEHLYDALGLDFLKVFRGIDIGPGKKLDNDIPLGDIDVLLINTDTKKIVCLEAKDYSESRTIWEMMSQAKKIKTAFDMPIKRDIWCRSHINSFKWVCTDVDESYSCSTVFVTFNMPAFHYIHSESKSPIRMIPALDIVDNPMIVFES